MIHQEILQELKESKNLLAFSAGVDSTALFFLLLEADINFDIAIVNYNLRKEAKEEVSYTKDLANRYNKKIYIADAPKFTSNFEANAREFRYNFFRKIIEEYGYRALLTAHQLNDRVEWLLMRLSQGSGIEGLSGMDFIEQREGFKLIRPLLHLSKEELINYLNSNNIKYFIDSSNFEQHYLRNRFRPIVNELLKDSKEGYLKSFAILQEEKRLLQQNFRLCFKEKELRIYTIKENSYFPYALSYGLKELGYLLSGKERQNLHNSMVVGRKWAVEYQSPYLFIAPYIQTVIPKKQRELFRRAKVPPKIRGYLHQESITLPKTYCGEDLSLAAPNRQ